MSPAQPLRILGSWPVALIIVALGVAQQAMGHINGDDSWFITFAEKVLDGARPYVDVSDPNPPAGFLVYMPAVFAARLFGISAEAATVVEILLCAFLSLALAGAIVSRATLLDADERRLARNAALWVVLVCAGFGFAEREHFALLACLPLLAATMARAEGRAVPPGLALLAGLGGGITLAFKPYFALGIAAASLAACARAASALPLAGRGSRAVRAILTPENFMAGATFLAYLAFIWFRYPDYFARVLPLAIEVYAPARNSMALVIASPPFLFNFALLAGLGYAAWKIGADSRAIVLAAASAGFFATYVMQAKIWFNHAWPGIALAVLALVLLALGRRAVAPEGAARLARLGVLPALLCAPFFAAVTMNAPGAEEYPGLTAAVRAHAPKNPKIAALAEQLDVAHPLTRRIGGTWVGTQNALWVNNCVRQILGMQQVSAARRAQLLGYVVAERKELAADIAAGRPDILLVETPALREWALTKPEFANLFDGFARKAQVGEIEVWGRKEAR